MNPPRDAEFAKFTNAMRGILKVSKAELNRRLEAEKEQKREPKASASRVPASAPKP